MGMTQRGLRDFMLQRVSAVVLAIYICFLFGFFVSHVHLTYERWHALFASVWMQVSTAVVLLLLMIHAWIGVWTICTDYIHHTKVRLFIEALVALTLLAYFFWGLHILWHV